MDNRSNQPNEGGNAFRNFVGRDVVQKGAKPTLESWIWQQKRLQNEAIGRWKEITQGGEYYKTKNKQCVKLDNILLSYVKEYNAGKLNDDEYFTKCVDAIKHAWSQYEEWKLNYLKNE